MKIIKTFLALLVLAISTQAGSLPIYNVPVIGVGEVKEEVDTVFDGPVIFGCIKKSWTPALPVPDVFGPSFLCPGLTCELDFNCSINEITLFKYTDCCVNAKNAYVSAIATAFAAYNTANNAAWDTYLACVEACQSVGPPSPQCLALCCNAYVTAEEAARSTVIGAENKAFREYKEAIQACVVSEDFCDDLDDCCDNSVNITDEALLFDGTQVFGCTKKGLSPIVYVPNIFNKEFLCPAFTCSSEDIDWTCLQEKINTFKNNNGCAYWSKELYLTKIATAVNQYNASNDASWNTYLNCVADCQSYGPPSPQCLAACCNAYMASEALSRHLYTLAQNKAEREYKEDIQMCVQAANFCDTLEECCDD